MNIDSPEVRKIPGGFEARGFWVALTFFLLTNIILSLIISLAFRGNSTRQQELQTQINDINKNTEALKAEVSTIINAISTIQNDGSIIVTDINELKTKLDALEQNNSNIQAIIEMLRDEIE